MLWCSFHACLPCVQLTYRVCALQFTHELCSIGLKTREKYRPILGVLRNHLETQMYHAVPLDRNLSGKFWKKYEVFVPSGWPGGCEWALPPGIQDCHQISAQRWSPILDWPSRTLLEVCKERPLIAHSSSPSYHPSVCEAGASQPWFRSKENNIIRWYWLVNGYSQSHKHDGDPPYLPLLILGAILEEVFQINISHTLLWNFTLEKVKMKRFGLYISTGIK